MISNNERREVAKRLRGLDATITNRDTLEQAVDKFMKAVCGDIPFSPIRYSVRNLCGLAGILADLIDRPTCKNLATKPADELLCSGCGEHVDIAYMESADDYHARYCPNCGAFIRGNNE